MSVQYGKRTKGYTTDSQTYNPVVTIYKGVSKQFAEEKCMSQNYTYKDIADGENYKYEDIYNCKLTK